MERLSLTSSWIGFCEVRKANKFKYAGLRYLTDDERKTMKCKGFVDSWIIINLQNILIRYWAIDDNATRRRDEKAIKETAFEHFEYSYEILSKRKRQKSNHEVIEGWRYKLEEKMMKEFKVEKDSVEESYRWAYGWRVVDGKCSPPAMNFPLLDFTIQARIDLGISRNAGRNGVNFQGALEHC